MEINEILNDIEERINSCKKEAEKEIKKQELRTGVYYQSKGEVLGYKTSLECIKRVREILQGGEMKTIWTSEEVYQDYLKSKYVDKSKQKQWLSKDVMIKLIDEIQLDIPISKDKASIYMRVLDKLEELKPKIENENTKTNS